MVIILTPRCLFFTTIYLQTKNIPKTVWHDSALICHNINNEFMSSSDNQITYLKYKEYGDLLKVILYSSQSVLGAVPLIYHLNVNNQNIIFIQTGAIGGNVIHYLVSNGPPAKKFIELKRLTGDYTFVEKIGTDGMSLYIPILELEKSNLKFP